MKLLTKEQIQQQKSFERKQEIDEGVKLATRVDKLRELSAQEHTNLMRFRDESIKRIQIEIDRYIAQKTQLKREVDDLEEKRRIALIPLDEEWNKLNKAKAEVDKAFLDLDVLSGSLAKQAREITQERIKVEHDKTRIADSKRSVSRNLKKSSRNLEESEAILAKAEYQAQKMEEKSVEKFKTLLMKEEELKYREVDLNNRDAFLKRKDEVINKKNAEVEHRYQTLLATEKRLKK